MVGKVKEKLSVWFHIDIFHLFLVIAFFWVISIVHFYNF